MDRDLEERTENFAKDVRALIKQLPPNLTNREDAKQLTRSSGSVAANYLESRERLTKKDMLHRLRIARKESKESSLWLRLLDIPKDTPTDTERRRLDDEASQLRNILSSIITKAT